MWKFKKNPKSGLKEDKNKASGDSSPVDHRKASTKASGITWTLDASMITPRGGTRSVKKDGNSFTRAVSHGARFFINAFKNKGLDGDRRATDDAKKGLERK